MIIIGHRGARGLAAENTLASIERALVCGVDEVEVDVRVTADDVPVLNHNRAISHDGKLYLIARHTAAELKKEVTDLALLEDALQLVRGRAVLHIEVKHGEPVMPVVQLLKSYSSKVGNLHEILLGSKSQRILRQLHQELPEVPKVVIEPWSGLRARYRAKQVATRRISMRSWWLWRGFLRAMQRSGYQLTPYTINTPGKAARWQPYIYGIVTDYPDRFSGMQATPVTTGHEQ
ncbi:MAG TPA: glycerophosphodiester phosphodiesterase [Candidatus Saccharimonadales bacterium]|nr:glycerophosphodiester phosphodiesterase [Candidatus Saccharimonadales bacterium]